MVEMTNTPFWKKIEELGNNTLLKQRKRKKMVKRRKNSEERMPQCTFRCYTVYYYNNEVELILYVKLIWCNIVQMFGVISKTSQGKSAIARPIWTLLIIQFARSSGFCAANIHPNRNPSTTCQMPASSLFCHSWWNQTVLSRFQANLAATSQELMININYLLPRRGRPQLARGVM